jgi:hypothetical protein
MDFAILAWQLGTSNTDALDILVADGRGHFRTRLGLLTTSEKLQLDIT